MQWEVISKSNHEMVLERGQMRKELRCPNNRVGSRIFAAMTPGQYVEELTIKLFLTDFSI